MSAPPPPADLARREPECILLPSGTVLHRFYPAGLEPIHFDRSRMGRLNAPDESYGVLYTAQEAHGAFAETFLRQPGRTLLDPGLLRRKGYARLETLSALKLIKLAGSGLAILGATAEVVHSGLPYDIPQLWSKELWAHPVGADGIAYHARHDDEALCYAIFDRVQDAIGELGRSTDLDRDWFWRLAGRYRLGIAP